MGGMRRTHLRRHPNILKRLLIHAGGFNLSLVLRKRTGFGKPRTLQDTYREGRATLSMVLTLCGEAIERFQTIYDAIRPHWSVTLPIAQAA